MNKIMIRAMQTDQLSMLGFLIGFALGVERLLMELAAQRVQLPQPAPPTVYLAVTGSMEQQAASLCFALRRQVCARKRIFWTEASRRR